MRHATCHMPFVICYLPLIISNMPDPLAKSFYRRFSEARAGWLRRLAPFVLMALLMWGLSGASALLLMRGQDSVVNYRTPLAKYPSAGEATEGVVSQVVLVVVDGLRTDAVRDMPTLQRLGAQGATAVVAVPWTISHPAWTTIVTGAEPEINDAALTHTGVARARIPETLFASARRANLNVAIAARDWWKPMVSAQNTHEVFFSDDDDLASSDHRNAAVAISFLEHFAPNFVFVYFALPEVTAHQHGATSPAYRQAAWHTDQLIAKLATALNLQEAALIITADHGHVDRGGHGGVEDIVAHAPFVAVGAHIKAGDYGLIQQADIAPTIAALLGSPIPSASQGNILFSLLALNDVQRATKAIALAKQQRELGLVYLNTIGGELSEAALKDAQVARSSLEVKNYDNAFRIAYLAAQQAQHDMRVARFTRIARERLARAPLAIFIIVLPLWFFWWQRGLRVVITAVMAVGVNALAHALYLFDGHLYSFSAFSAAEPFLRDLAARLTLALAFGGLLTIIYHWRSDTASRTRVTITFWLVCLWSVYLNSIPFALGYYVNGLEAQWYLGDRVWAFWQLWSMASVTLLSALAAPLAILTAITYWLALVILHRLLKLFHWTRSLPWSAVVKTKLLR